jgi:catechol 2,3-dioxygenase-like lactoylglutathione lyase family enzyme
MRIEWGTGSTMTFPVKDLEAAVAWYRDVRGFEVLVEMPDWGWAQFRTPIPGLKLGLSRSDDEARAPENSLTFDVVDIDAARAFLEERGVRFDGDTSEVEGTVRLAPFFDLEGNQLGLAQRIQ